MEDKGGTNCGKDKGLVFLGCGGNYPELWPRIVRSSQFKRFKYYNRNLNRLNI
jgi:hypothetical protein